MSESDVKSAATMPPSEFVTSMVEQVPAAVVITDLDGHVQYWNPHAEVVFGWGGHEAAGRRFADLVVPSFMRQRAAAIREATAEHRHWRGELRLAHRSGRTFPALLTRTAICDAAGRPVALTNLILEQREPGESIDHADLARAVLDGTELSAAVLDRTSAIISVNRSWLAFSDDNGGSQAATGVGVSYLDVCERAAANDPAAASVCEALRKVLAGDLPRWTTEYPCDSPTEARWFRLELAPLPDGGAIVIHANITEQVEARHAAEELARAKDRFVASISHELRTPLTAVLGLAEELAWSSDLDAATVAEFHVMIAEQARDVANLVEDLLVVARIESSSFHVVSLPVDLGAEAVAVARPYRAAGRAVGVTPSHASTTGDPIRVRQIIRNLVSNAFRYGGPDVWIETGTTDGHAWLEVSDDGPGVDPDHVERMFQPFSALSLSTPESVGIGLTVARSLARMMGGSLDYHRDDRTRFRLALPAR